MATSYSYPLASPVHPHGSVAATPHFDPGALACLYHFDRDHGSQVYRRALLLYLADCNPLVARLASAAVLGDQKQIIAASQALRQGSEMIGATRVAQQCHSIELESAANRPVQPADIQELEMLVDAAGEQILEQIRALSVSH